jgi:fatty-acid desaturase
LPEQCTGNRPFLTARNPGRPDKAIRDDDIQEYMENVLNTLDPRLRDILISVAAFMVLLLLIAILPFFFGGGIVFLAAIIVFIIIMSWAGLMVNQKVK